MVISATVGVVNLLEVLLTTTVTVGIALLEINLEDASLVAGGVEVLLCA